MPSNAQSREKWFSSAAMRYAACGILCGTVFPVICTNIEIIRQGLPWTVSHWLTTHFSNYLLWILDGAPLTLGILAWFMGRHEGRLAQTVRALEESKALALEAANGGVWEWSINPDLFETTALLKRSWGYADDEACTSFADFASRIHPDDHNRIKLAVTAHLEQHASYHEQFRVRSKDGTYRWVDMRGQARWDAQGRVTKMSGAIRDISEKRHLEEQVQNTVQRLARSTAEVVTTLTRLVSNTIEAAEAVTETATTVEEVKQTAFAAHQKAQEMSGAGRAAVQVSRTGEQAVNEATNGLNHIREQMNAIAQSVVKLGEKSQTIGTIIAAVTDLADQSNLLAVNAAIEAAKAGTQGKGFTVVAQEVKRLAEQSKRATAQVRTLLGEIQQASMSAVLVTEQGAKSVETGVTQAMDAGESIRTLARSINDASHALTQVAAFGQQQMVEMGHVAQAMDSIKKASTENAAGMQQMEEALHTLNHLGQSLTSLIAEYTGTRARGAQLKV